MFIDEQQADSGILWLLQGCPRRWFARGQEIIFENAPTLFGKMALRTKSKRNTITVDIDSPSWTSPKEMRIVIRHPKQKAMKSATVNGSPAKIDGDTVILPNPTGHLQIVCNY